MIPLPGIRDKGAAPLLGAEGPGGAGPFGAWPTEPDEDDGQDDVQATVRNLTDDQDHDTHRLRPSTGGRPIPKIAV